MALRLKLEKVYPYRSRYRKCPRRTSGHVCPSQALEQSPVQTSYNYDLLMRGREGTLHLRPAVIPCTHLFDHNGRILRIRERDQRPHRWLAARAHVDIDDIFVPVVVHLSDNSGGVQRVLGRDTRVIARAHTSSASVEFPQPSMRMRAVLSRRTGRRRCATSS